MTVNTQWRVGNGGAYGLDYSIFPMIFDMYEITGDKKRMIFEDIRIMESEALSYFKSLRD